MITGESSNKSFQNNIFNKNPNNIAKTSAVLRNQYLITLHASENKYYLSIFYQDQ